MMKATATFFALLLVAGAAFAQETPRPDYSREAIREFAMRIEVEESEQDTTHRYDPLALRFGAFGTTWDVNLPGPRMRLSGTELGVGVTQQFPNPFLLTNTTIATSPRAMARYKREVSRELNRINKRLKATVDVKTK